MRNKASCFVPLPTYASFKLSLRDIQEAAELPQEHFVTRIRFDKDGVEVYVESDRILMLTAVDTAIPIAVEIALSKHRPPDCR